MNMLSIIYSEGFYLRKKFLDGQTFPSSVKVVLDIDGWLWIASTFDEENDWIIHGLRK